MGKNDETKLKKLMSKLHKSVYPWFNRSTYRISRRLKIDRSTKDRTLYNTCSLAFESNQCVSHDSLSHPSLRSCFATQNSKQITDQNPPHRSHVSQLRQPSAISHKRHAAIARGDLHRESSRPHQTNRNPRLRPHGPSESATSRRCQALSNHHWTRIPELKARATRTQTTRAKPNCDK